MTPLFRLLLIAAVICVAVLVVVPWLQEQYWLIREFGMRTR